MTEIGALPITGKSTIYLSENSKIAKSPAYINVKGAATISVKGRGAVLVDSKSSYDVSGNNATIDETKSAAKQSKFTDRDYVNVDDETTLDFNKPAFLYVRGDATIIISGEATFDKPSIIIRYVELLKGASGLSIVTSLGALVYLLVSSYGSGSYGDVMEPWQKSIVDSALLLSIILLGFVFIYSLWLLLTEQFSYSEKKDYHPLDPYKIYGFWALVVASALMILSAIISYYNTYWASILPLIAVGIAIIYIAIFVIFDVMRGEFVEVLILLAIVFTASTFWLNTYRDNHKAALVTDAEYCHWLEAPSAENVCKKFEGNPLSYRAKLAN